MKAIIFDLDNTLIEWKDEYIGALKKVLKDLNLDCSDELVYKIDSCLDGTEKEKLNDYLDKEQLLKYINDKCNINLPNDFLDRLIIEQGNCYCLDSEVEDTLKYLASKYDLYLISNWFTETQKKRLENMHVAKYFKKIIGADKNYYKPNPKAFDIILEKYQSSDCISIGDTLENDVIAPLKLGMDAYLKSNIKNDKYKTIAKISELKNIL